jgi:hypothetical protein
MAAIGAPPPRSWKSMLSADQCLHPSLSTEKKLIAESLLQENKTTLGWILDTRRLLIRLTMTKFSSWSASIYFMVITSATGWLRKSIFSEHNHPLQLEAARHLATLLLMHGVTLYSQ